jgi:hypothetical protein
VSGGFEGCHIRTYIAELQPLLLQDLVRRLPYGSRRIRLRLLVGSTTIAKHCNPELARCCAIYNLSVFFLGCCLTLWSFLVQIGQVLFVAAAWPSTRITGADTTAEVCNAARKSHDARRGRIFGRSLRFSVGILAPIHCLIALGSMKKTSQMCPSRSWKPCPYMKPWSCGLL